MRARSQVDTLISAVSTNSGAGGVNTNLYARTNDLNAAMVALSYPAPAKNLTNSSLFDVTRAIYSTNMVVTGAVYIPFPTLELRAECFNDVLLVAAETNVWLFSITNRAVPVLKASLGTSTTNHFITHHENFFYVVGDGFIHVFNCSISALPTLITNLSLGTATAGKASVKDGLLLVGCGNPGMVKIFSLANPAAPVQLSEIAVSGGGVADVLKRGPLVYIADYLGKTLKVADIANPLAPVIVHSQPAADHGDASTFEPWRLMSRGTALYVADDQWLQIFTLANPTNPVFYSAIHITPLPDGEEGPIPADTEGSQVVGDIMLWAMPAADDASGQVAAFDIADPFSPIRFTQGNTSFGNGFSWLGASEDFLYSPSRSVNGMSNVLTVLTMPKLPLFTDKTGTLLVGITNAIRFPLATNNTGRVITVKITANVTNVLTAIGNDRLELATTRTLTNGEAVTFQSDGTTNWWELNRKKELPSGVITNNHSATVTLSSNLVVLGTVTQLGSSGVNLVASGGTVTISNSVNTAPGDLFAGSFQLLPGGQIAARGGTLNGLSSATITNLSVVTNAVTGVSLNGGGGVFTNFVRLELGNNQAIESQNTGAINGKSSGNIRWSLGGAQAGTLYTSKGNGIAAGTSQDNNTHPTNQAEYLFFRTDGQVQVATNLFLPLGGVVLGEALTAAQIPKFLTNNQSMFVQLSNATQIAWMSNNIVAFKIIAP